MKKVLGITTIRSDYDLMSELYRKIQNEANLELKLLVAGTHLSSTYGHSIDLIRKDGFEILLELETLIDSNSKQSRLKSASLLLQNSIDTIAQYKPDVILYAGDREDTLICAMIGSYLQIPTIHFYGGDHVPDGHVDNPVRHAVSKLSSLHFVAIEQHKERLIKIGEEPERVFVVGSISLDRFVNFNPLPLSELKKKFSIKSGFDKFAIVIFHPHDIEMQKSHLYFETILSCLKEKNINAFVSYPNTDPGNRIFFNVIDKFVNDKNFIFYKNLERELFLSIYKNSFLQIGNSSSGIIEATSLHIPVVNVGMRQVGRLQNGNVIFTGTTKKEILQSIDKAISDSFRLKIKKINNIYGDGKSAEKALSVLKRVDPQKYLYKTYDIMNS